MLNRWEQAWILTKHVAVDIDCERCKFAQCMFWDCQVPRGQAHLPPQAQHFSVSIERQERQWPQAQHFVALMPACDVAAVRFQILAVSWLRKHPQLEVMAE